MDHEQANGRILELPSPSTDAEHPQVAQLNQETQSLVDSWNCSPPSPYSLAMMQETIAISQSIEQDARTLDVPYPGMSSDSDATPTMNFPWDYPVEDVQRCREQWLRPPAKGGYDAAEGVWPYDLLKNEPNKKLELGSGSMAPTLPAQAGTASNTGTRKLPAIKARRVTGHLAN
ncbi:hypothetical protein O1611_g9504 [Lasiodiplodia mahajangana]|uniref:Uncharacterized protein n=1 Tax=Lasiodiplodia mahajangana TaxID=1108764 RepID=A0ACC2J9G3_9PEZI|nr:hypothetical protein O1611_g9504 [Lasiodiplodia mahajangana]